MAPIFYCSCTNCSFSATVLPTQTADMEGEGNRLKEVAGETTRTANCENTRKSFNVEYKNDESHAWELVESIVLLFIVAVLLFGKYMCLKTELTIHKYKFVII